MLRNTPGIIALNLIFLVILSIPVSLVFVFLYRRFIQKTMNQKSGDLVSFDAIDSSASTHAPTVTANNSRTQVRVFVVYAAAAAGASLLWSFLYFYKSDLEFQPLRDLVIFLTFAWLVVPSLAILLVWDWKKIFLISACYAAAAFFSVSGLAVAVHLVLGHSQVPAWHNGLLVLKSLAISAAPLTAVILITSQRRWRGVVPLVAAGLLVFLFGATFATELFARLTDSRLLRSALLALGMRSWFMLLTVPIGYLCWRMLKFLNRQYQRRSFSDQQLLVDTFWVMAAFVQVSLFYDHLGLVSLWALAGFVIYRALIELGFRLWPSSEPAGKRLLILRVFGFRQRSERLFDAIVNRWRFRGSVCMIAGPDLAARTINPDDALAFAGGELPDRFVGSPEDLAQQLSKIDTVRDPDGRCRLTQFFCHDNAWQATLTSLLNRSDLILMDLRGFSKDRTGIMFELAQLKTLNRLRDTVFVLDGDPESASLLRSILDTADLNIVEVKNDSSRSRHNVYCSLELAST